MVIGLDTKDALRWWQKATNDTKLFTKRKADDVEHCTAGRFNTDKWQITGHVYYVHID